MKIIKIVFLFILALATVGCPIERGLNQESCPTGGIGIDNRCDQAYTYSMMAPDMTGAFYTPDGDIFFSGMEYTAHLQSGSNELFETYNEIQSSIFADLINGKKFILTIKKDGKVIRTYTESVFRNTVKQTNENGFVDYIYTDDFIEITHGSGYLFIVLCGGSDYATNKP
ncbi:hypothetical protein [Desulfovibrio litoralis]|uniref:Lipoprotein n=1 Tax=Desulfovibrio litoralis DSM 11393 TaxID=1121455 RepID=A0A1M7TLA3_9BACT|nr:hypothetical protein [Desulfovibrio litoralis]SHN71504.1 hypothetical protein SAMN02745728_02199 [Desulfovibrio litoralis DSM 11393]